MLRNLCSLEFVWKHFAKLLIKAPMGHAEIEVFPLSSDKTSALKCPINLIIKKTKQFSPVMACSSSIKCKQTVKKVYNKFVKDFFQFRKMFEPNHLWRDNLIAAINGNPQLPPLWLQNAGQIWNRTSYSWTTRFDQVFPWIKIFGPNQMSIITCVTHMIDRQSPILSY